MTIDDVQVPLPPAVVAPRPKPASRRRGRRHPVTLKSTLKHLALIAGSVVMIYPLIWLVVSSFKPNDDIFRDLSIFTTHLTAENYINGWNDLQSPFGVFLLNSTVIAVGSIIGSHQDVGRRFVCSSPSIVRNALRTRSRRASSASQMIL